MSYYTHHKSKILTPEILKNDQENCLPENDYQVALHYKLEQERGRIARELHDQIGPELTAISMLAHKALAHTDSPSNVTELLERIAALSAGAQDLLGEVIWGMTPDYDQWAVFGAYVRNYALKTLEHHGSACSVHIAPSEDKIKINGPVRRNLFLVLKESLNNILKHANAGKVEVTLGFEATATDMSLWKADGIQVNMQNSEFKIQNEEYRIIEPIAPNLSLPELGNRMTIIVMTIKDDGKGFEHASPPPYRNGMKNMQSRAEEIGARLQVFSELGEGTSVVVRVDATSRG
jgi:signal transduction histidine kinase